MLRLLSAPHLTDPPLPLLFPTKQEEGTENRPCLANNP